MTGQTPPYRRIAHSCSAFVWVLLWTLGCACRSVPVTPEPSLLSQKLAGVDDFGTLLVDAGVPTTDLPGDAQLTALQVRDLLLQLDLDRPKPSEEAPWTVANFVLREVTAQNKKTVAKTELSLRLGAFENLYMLRRDGCFAHALSGKAAQCAGPVEVRDGALRAGQFEVDRFYTRDTKQQWQLADTALAVAPAR